MKANNLSICMPYKGCDMKGHCANYCISKITGFMEKSDYGYMRRNIDKVRNFAKMANITSVSFTSKGEPMLDKGTLYTLMTEFEGFPLELQTNGIEIKENLTQIIQLSNFGLDVLAISFDTLGQFNEFYEVFKKAHKFNLTTRVTYNITNLTPKGTFIGDLIDLCNAHEVDQFSIRNIVAPNFCKENAQTKWIRENVDESFYSKMKAELERIEKRLLRTLPYGATLYEVDGVAVTCFDYCVQDNSNDKDVRSLIFAEDGHLYTSWNSLASRIF